MLSLVLRTAKSAINSLHHVLPFARINPSPNLLNANRTNLLSPVSMMQPLRFATFGQEYQPSTLRRKRRHGFLRRLRTKNGRKVLMRRIMKGRRHLCL